MAKVVKDDDTSNDEIMVSLDDYCAGLSAERKSVAIISGFYHSETERKTTKDNPSAFNFRFNAFVNGKPKG